MASCVLCARVRGRVSRSCATENTCKISEQEVKEQGLQTIDSRLVIKEKADGVVKARLCAKDFAHTKSDDLYAPTPSPAIVRTLLTRAHRRGWDTCLMDFMQAFLHAPIDDDKVILWPSRSVRRHGWLWVLKKALDGLRVAPQRFHDWLANLFVSLGFWQMVGHPAYFLARREGRRDCDSHR